MKKWRRQSYRRKLPGYIREKIKSCQDLPGVFKDRVLRLGILSFLILLFGIFMGNRMESLRYVLWSVIISMIVLIQALRVLQAGLLGNYEVVEGTVLEIYGKLPLGKFYKVKIRSPDGGETTLLLEKSVPVEKGVRYRFYFNCRKEALSGIETVDAAWNLGSFYGFEQVEKGR